MLPKWVGVRVFLCLNGSDRNRSVMRKSHLFPSWLFRSLAALVAAASALSSLQAQTVPVNFASGTATAATGQALATTWQTQTFGKTFAAAPVVVMGPAFSADGQPHAVRVRSVSPKQFPWPHV
jgi:hypothetical protein